MLDGLHLGHVGAAALAAFLASAVEFVEALTVVLAIGAVRGWRSALAGTACSLFLLLLIVLTAGSALARIPLDMVQLFVGALLLLMGLRWLRKAVLRAAGIIPLHDEAALFEQETAELLRMRRNTKPLDEIAFAGAFKIVMLEGIEVVFIVLAIGASRPGLLVPAAAGALAAFAVVAALGLALHKPIASLPENALKFAVGVLISAFGTFWAGEGIGVDWPGDDLALLALTAGYFAVAFTCVRLIRRSRTSIRGAAI